METATGNSVYLDRSAVSNAVMFLASTQQPVAVVRDDYDSRQVTYVEREPELRFVTARRPDVVTYAKPMEVEQVTYFPPAPIKPTTVIYPSTPAVDTRFMYKPAYLGRKHNTDYYQVSFQAFTAFCYGAAEPPRNQCV